MVSWQILLSIQQSLSETVSYSWSVLEWIKTTQNDRLTTESSNMPFHLKGLCSHPFHLVVIDPGLSLEASSTVLWLLLTALTAWTCLTQKVEQTCCTVSLIAPFFQQLLPLKHEHETDNTTLRECYVTTELLLTLKGVSHSRQWERFSF